jgi:hypothetical protein
LHPRFQHYASAYVESFFSYSTPEEQTKLILFMIDRVTRIGSAGFRVHQRDEHFEMVLAFGSRNRHPFAIHRNYLRQLIHLVEEGPAGTKSLLRDTYQSIFPVEYVIRLLSQPDHLHALRCRGFAPKLAKFHTILRPTLVRFLLVAYFRNENIRSKLAIKSSLAPFFRLEAETL